MKFTFVIIYISISFVLISYRCFAQIHPLHSENEFVEKFCLCKSNIEVIGSKILHECWLDGNIVEKFIFDNDNLVEAFWVENGRGTYGISKNGTHWSISGECADSDTVYWEKGLEPIYCFNLNMSIDSTTYQIIAVTTIMPCLGFRKVYSTRTHKCMEFTSYLALDKKASKNNYGFTTCFDTFHPVGRSVFVENDESWEIVDYDRFGFPIRVIRNESNDDYSIVIYLKGDILKVDYYFKNRILFSSQMWKRDGSRLYQLYDDSGSVTESRIIR